MNSNKLHVLLGGPMLAVLVVTVLMLTNGSRAAILGTIGSCNVYDEVPYEGNNGAQIIIEGNAEFTAPNGSTGCFATGSKTNDAKVRCATGNPYDITSGPNAGQVVCAKAGTAGAKEGTEWTWGTIASQSTTPSTSTTGSITPSTTTTTPSTITTTPSTTTTTPSTTTTTPSTTSSTTTTTPSKPACTTNDWSCADWGACSATGIQRRTCTLSTACTGYPKKPVAIQKCTAPETTQTTAPITQNKETAKPAAVEKITQAAQDKTTQPTTQQQTDQDQQPQQETPPVVEEPSEDTTISFKDTENEDVIDLVTRMVNLGALKIPKETIFGLKKKTSRSYMLRIALTVKGEKVGCGKNPKTKCIISKAKDAGLIETYKKGSVTKIESYELLLKAAGSGIDEEITGKSPCEDVKADDEIAPIIATAKREGILNKFKYQGKKGYCLPNAAVPKGEAAFTAMQLLRQENE